MIGSITSPYVFNNYDGQTLKCNFVTPQILRVFFFFENICEQCSRATQIFLSSTQEACRAPGLRTMSQHGRPCPDTASEALCHYRELSVATQTLKWAVSCPSQLLHFQLSPSLLSFHFFSAFINLLHSF